MAGTIRQRSKNSYRLEYMCNGVRYSETVKATSKKEAQLLLADFVNRVDKGSFINVKYTFLEYSQLWLDNVARPTISPVTVKKYISYLNNRILPYFAHTELQQISPLMITDFYNYLKKSKCARGGTLANASVKRIANIVSAILEHATQMGVIDSNPCHKAKLQFAPAPVDDAIHYYDKNTYNRVLSLLKNESLEHRTIIELALKSGARRSELFGLTWQDIDFDKCTIDINKTRQYLTGEGMFVKGTKTKGSNRVIQVPQSAIDLLKEYKNKYPNNEYLFENISIDGVCSWFKNWQLKNHIEPIRFHDLRHTHATLLLLNGVDVKTIQHRLGHSDISMTLNVYAHVLNELDRRASNVFDEI